MKLVDILNRSGRMCVRQLAANRTKSEKSIDFTPLPYAPLDSVKILDHGQTWRQKGQYMQCIIFQTNELILLFVGSRRW